MKKLLPIIIILVAGIAGGGGGYFFKLQASQGGGEEHAAADGEHGEKSDDGHGDKKDKKKKKKKGGHGEADTSSTVYMKFGRQFVVPVVQNGKPRSMMIMDINIEVDSEQGETVYAYEPRLRDAILSHLIMKAGDGDLPLMLEDTAVMEKTKAEILAISKTIIGDGALQVLIQDIGMQSY
ncbi:flagellar basal body-associated FliL family protein [Hyphococcus flavus]|uniref:Flagellar basal body-associated FliL family protein n=1 Tax=Hyphococcus flavus TaxID=1866326 RepID=A0AAE9ZJB0_9PROT|nr:flagellar basal body-associated FliL family protein [Hyphococcus flavus]WDI31545.1 flagellar basal body-associated FliL family protein [Hyphococcus flavus]